MICTIVSSFPFSVITFFRITMPSSIKFIFHATAISTLGFPYPLPIIVKHPIWYFEDADFFISIREIVFGLHRKQFERSSYFRSLFVQNDPTHPESRGNQCSRPLPFNELPESLLLAFLSLLYKPEYFSASINEWKDLRQLSIYWYFGHEAALAIQHLITLQERLFPINQRNSIHQIVSKDSMEIH